ncbi:HRDC domain-containing protein [Phthorimaea operculella]|nr:HRDC domain-containing protein [Phthorimaea operculella]
MLRCRYQLADWRIRPLPAELVEYARMDTHYLLYIWRRMKAELLEAGAGQPTLLLSVFEQSRQICGQTYKKEVVDDTSHMRLYVRSKKSFNSQQMAALQLLYKWRDEQARQLDESTMYLLPNHMLLSLAETLPREVQGVNACCSPMPPFVKQNLITIHRMILSCRELPLEPQLYQMPASIRNMQNTTHHSLAACNLHDLSHMPDFSCTIGAAAVPDASKYPQHAEHDAPLASRLQPARPLTHARLQMPASIRNMQNTTHHSLAACNLHDLSHMPDFR